MNRKLRKCKINDAQTAYRSGNKFHIKKDIDWSSRISNVSILLSKHAPDILYLIGWVDHIMFLHWLARASHVSSQQLSWESFLELNSQILSIYQKVTFGKKFIYQTVRWNIPVTPSKSHKVWQVCGVEMWFRARVVSPGRLGEHKTIVPANMKTMRPQSSSVTILLRHWETSCNKLNV